MKPKLISHFQVILFLFIVSACTTERIIISVLQPAEISIPPSIQKISLFPGAGIPDPPGTYDSISRIKLKPDYNYNPIKRGYMQGLYEVIQETPRFTRVVLTDTIYENLVASGVISWDDLRQICIHDSTDAVLLLKKAVSYDILDYVYEDDYCSLRYNLVTHTKWCFYQPFLYTASDDLIFTDFNNYEQPLDNCQPQPLQNITGILYDACVQSGSKLGERISPGWQDDIQRIIYKGPGKSLKQAYFLASHHQWNQAAAIWYELSGSKKKNQATRASCNLALTWERDDEFEQAIQWILYADSIRSTQNTREYAKILEQRIQFKEELDNQLKGK